MRRRERTHHLIELGGLVAKSGLVELADDDRAAIYGALLSLNDHLDDRAKAEALIIWRRRGRRAFEDEESERLRAEALRLSLGRA